jgi:hypothetical protein
MGAVFLHSLLRPITEATVLGSIFAGIVIAILYWRKIPVSPFNGFIFNLGFFTVMYITRRYVDGVDSAAGYVGIFILYTIFLVSAFITHRIIRKISERT